MVTNCGFLEIKASFYPANECVVHKVYTTNHSYMHQDKKTLCVCVADKNYDRKTPRVNADTSRK